MAAVAREYAISWAGKTYRFVPSNALIRRIEGEGVSLIHMVSELRTGRPRISHVALVVAECLRSAGADVDEDEMLSALLGADAVKVMLLACDILGAIFPAVDGKKPSAPPAGPAQTKKKSR